jgi:hypothetical protein
MLARREDRQRHIQLTRCMSGTHLVLKVNLAHGLRFAAAL